MRLLELAHKCPKSKELKRASEYKRVLTSSLGAVLDKLEAKYGTKLYTTRHQHPSIKGMEENKNKKSKNNKSMTNINTSKQTENKQKANDPIIEQRENIEVDKESININIDTKPKSKPNPMPKALNPRHNIADERPLHINRPKYDMNMMMNENKQIQVPRATSRDLIGASTSYESKSVTYESKKEETETTNTPKHKDNSMDIDTDNDNDNDRNILQAINRNNHNYMKRKRSSMNMDNFNECDLNAYNFSAPSCKNATVKFHVAIEKNDDNLSMTERYEQLKHQQSEKMKNINTMKEQYNKISVDLDKYYSFNARPFQETSCTDYALFQLESIRQKLKSQQELKGGNGNMNDSNISRSKSLDLMEEDGIDDLLNSLLNDQEQR